MNTFKISLGARALVATSLLTLTAAASEVLRIEPTEDGLQTRNHDGQVVWRLELPTGPAVSYELDARGNLLVDRRYVVDGAGRLLETLPRRGGRTEALAHAPVSLAQEGQWQPPTPIVANDVFGAQTPPLIDSAGTAWAIASVIDQETGSGALAVAQSLNRDGQWTPAEIVYLRQPPGASTPVPFATIDPQDNITIVFRELNEGRYEAFSLRYEPATGWSDAQRIFSTERFFQQLDIEADSLGNVVVSIQVEERNGEDRAVALIYDADAGQWGNPRALSAQALGDTQIPTLVASANRSSLWAVYWVRTPPGIGFYARRFDSETRTFDPPERVPGTAIAGVPGFSGPGSYIPLALDDAGVLTVAHYLRFRFGPEFTLWILRASRREANGWNVPKVLLAHGNFEPNLTEFSDAVANAQGDVFLLLTRFDDAADETLRYAIRYDAAAGTWEAPFVLFANPRSGETRMRVVARDDLSAHAAYVALDESGPRLRSFIETRLFENGEWSPPQDIPGDPEAGEFELAAAGGDSLLLYGLDSVLFGTWYRPVD